MWLSVPISIINAGTRLELTAFDSTTHMSQLVGRSLRDQCDRCSPNASTTPTSRLSDFCGSYDQQEGELAFPQSLGYVEVSCSLHIGEGRGFGI